MVKKYLVTITDDSGYESAFIFNNLKSVIEGIGIKYNLEFDMEERKVFIKNISKITNFLNTIILRY